MWQDSIKKVSIASLGLALLFTISACGNKGPLYLPEPESPPKQERTD